MRRLQEMNKFGTVNKARRIAGYGRLLAPIVSRKYLSRILDIRNLYCAISEYTEGGNTSAVIPARTLRKVSGSLVLPGAFGDGQGLAWGHRTVLLSCASTRHREGSGSEGVLAFVPDPVYLNFWQLF